MAAHDEIVNAPRPRPVAGVRRLGPGLRHYVARSLAGPTGVALLGLGAAYLTRSLLEWSDLIVNRGLGGAAVALLAVYELVPVLSQVLPFATLIGVLAGLGHLRATGELKAVEACGVSPRRLARPVGALAAALTALALLLSLWLAPASRSARTDAFLALLAEQPGATLTAGPVHEFGDHRLTAREVSSRGDVLRGVVLWSPALGETLFAEGAHLMASHGGGIELALQDATILLGPAQGGSQIEVGTFRAELMVDREELGGYRHTLEAASPTELLERSRAGPVEGADGDAGDPASAAAGSTASAASDAAANAAANAAAELDEASRARAVRQARLALAELHRRVALPLAVLLLALVAVPAALAGAESSRTAGAVRGIALTVVYYGLVQLGNGLLRRPDVPVAVAIWTPNLVMAGAAAWLYARPLTTAGARGGGGGGSGRRWVRGPGVLPALPLERFLLARYVATLFIQLALLCIAALFLAYLLVDVLERLQWFARYESTLPEVVRFYGARAPLLLSRVAAMGLLVAASLTISQLDRHGELVAMQACGLSAVRALAPISVVALLAAPVYFLVTDAVVPRTNALADHLKVTEIKGDRPQRETTHFVWHRIGANLLQADRMDERSGVATDVTLYELDERGFPKARIDAGQAHRLGEGEWELVDARRVEISGEGVRRTEAPTRIQLGSDPEDLDPMHLDVRELAREIRRARADGYGTTAFEVDLQARLAAPFACILLPWIAVSSALTGRRRQTASRNLVVAVVLAVAFELVGDLGLSLGYGERVPPVLAAWSPILLLGVLAVGLAVRARR